MHGSMQCGGKGETPFKRKRSASERSRVDGGGAKFEHGMKPCGVRRHPPLPPPQATTAVTAAPQPLWRPDADCVRFPGQRMPAPCTLLVVGQVCNGRGSIVASKKAKGQAMTEVSGERRGGGREGMMVLS